MVETWGQAIDVMRSRKLVFAQIARVAGISEKTVRNAVQGRTQPHSSNRTLILTAVNALLDDVSGNVGRKNKESEKQLSPKLEL
jgi:predicted transcriptional regulator